MTIEEQSGENAVPIKGSSAVESPIEPSVREREIDDIGLRDAAKDLGARLRTARESAKMTVEAAGDHLKLMPETILALENGELAEAGGKGLIYIEGYYRAYANALDLEIGDTRFAIDHARPIETGAGLTPQINYQSISKQVLTERLRERSDAIILGLVAIMVVVVGGIIWLVWPSSDELGTTATGIVVTPSDPPQAQTTADNLPFYLQDESQSATDTVSSEFASGSDLNAVSRRSESSIDAPNAEVEIPAETFNGDDGSVTPPSIERATDSLSEFNLVPGTSIATQEAGRIEITFRGPSWVEVYGGDDARLYYKMGQAGEVAALVGLIPFTLRIGDASVVSVRYNDSEIDLAPFTFGNVANLTVQ